RMEKRREAESDLQLVEAPGYLWWSEIDVHAELFQAIGRATRARDPAVAVLGDRHAARCRDERRSRADIKGVQLVSAGAARIEQCVVLCANRRDALMHGPRGTDDLADTLPFDTESRQESGRLDFAGLAVHNGRERRAGLPAFEI